MKRILFAAVLLTTPTHAAVKCNEVVNPPLDCDLPAEFGSLPNDPIGHNDQSAKETAEQWRDRMITGIEVEYLSKLAQCNKAPTMLGVWYCRSDAATARSAALANNEQFYREQKAKEGK